MNCLLRNCFATILISSMSFGVHAEGSIIIGIRGNEAATEVFASSIPGAAIATEDTREFESGGTDVHILTPLVSKAVTILLPQSLTPNTLMEALIKTRIARQNGARKINIESPTALSTIPVLNSRGAQIGVPVDSMLAVAGAQFVHEAKGKTRGLSPESMWLFAKADPTKSVIFGDQHRELRDELSLEMNIPVLNRSTDLPSAQVFYLAPFISPANETFFQQMADIRELVASGARVELVTPYLPYARSDRMGGDGTTVVGRLVADLMESVGISSITFIRAHAPQSEGHFRIPTFHLSGMKTMIPVLRSRKVTIVVSPDNGATKDATLYADALGAALAVINKQRDKGSKKIRIVGMTAAFLNGKKVSMKNRVVLVPDDESDSGSTGSKAGARIIKQKPKRTIFKVIHLRGSAKAALESPDIDEVIVSNSLPIPAELRKNVTVVSIAPELGQSLSRLVLCQNPLAQIASTQISSEP